MNARAKIRKISTRQIVLVGMFAALLTVVSQISLPMPSGVPITIQVFGVALTGVVLGWKLGAMVTVVYILIGAVGMPVFANFIGGLGIITGLSGGYIIGMPFLAAFSGIRLKSDSKIMNLAGAIALTVAGLAIMEGIGGLQWSYLAGDMSIKAIFIYSFVAFIPKDMLLCVFAVIVGNQMRRILIKAGMCI